MYNRFYNKSKYNFILTFPHLCNDVADYGGIPRQLKDELKNVIYHAYVKIGSVNQYIAAASNHTPRSSAWTHMINRAQQDISSAMPLIQKAKEELLKFLSTEQD